jgi:hypothetical protein
LHFRRRTMNQRASRTFFVRRRRFASLRDLRCH